MKKIKQWFCGILISLYGTIVIICFVALVFNFICMMNTSGWEFVGYFCSFIFDLGLCVFMPYTMFLQFEDSICDRWKINT